MTKVEIKALLEERKQTFKAAWSSSTDDSEIEDGTVRVPSNLKKFTIQDRKIVLQQSIRVRPENPGESYDRPEDSKKIDLAEPGEEPKLAWIATDLTLDEEDLLISTVKEYRDVFAWSYKDLNGVDPAICQHTIPMKDDAKPSKKRPYTYNENFANKIKEEIDKLLDAELIYEIEHTEWVSFSGYNQVSIDEKDQHKTTFATEWGVFAYRVMPFGLTNVVATF